MTMLAAYGLDNYDSIGEFVTLEPEWIQVTGGSSGSNSLSTTGGRFGGGALVHNSGINGTYGSTLIFSSAQPKTLFFGVSFKSPAVTNTAIFLEFRQSTSVHFALRQLAGGNSVQVQILGSDAGSFTLSKDLWHRIEVKLTVDDAAGEVTIRLDGDEVFTSTGIDTQAGANAWTDTFSLQSPSPSSTPTVTFDDITINDDQGSFNNDFLGDLKIETLRPDADGDINEFTRSAGTTNFENVDESPGPNDDTDYVESSTIGHQDLYTITDLSGSPDTIYATIVRATARKDDAGDRSINLLVNTGVTDIGATQTLLTDYSNFEEIHEVDPGTSVAWTVTGVNAAQIGQENV